MKSICMITSVHSHDDVRIFHKEAKALRDAGYEVTILSPDYAGDKEGIKFVQLEFYQERKKRLFTSWKIAYLAVKDLPYDAFHLHDPELLPAGRRLKKLGKTVIYDAHEDLGKQILSKQWIPHWMRNRVSKLVRRYVKHTVEMFDLCIAATDSIGSQFANAIVVHNYPDEREADLLYSNQKYCTREDNVCYIGAITQTRGIRESVFAIGKTSAKLLLAGKYESIELETDLEQMPQYQQVNYLGNVSRKEIWDTLNNSKIGLLLLQNTPAYMDSMPIKLFEYMMAGIPVIASDFPIWKETVGTSCVRYVDYTNIEEIADNIIYLLDNPDIAEKMGQAGQRLAREKFNFKKEKEKLLRGYQKIFV